LSFNSAANVNSLLCFAIHVPVDKRRRSRILTKSFPWLRYNSFERDDPLSQSLQDELNFGRALCEDVHVLFNFMQVLAEKLLKATLCFGLKFLQATLRLGLQVCEL
jgi:hypothetical protein